MVEIKDVTDDDPEVMGSKNAPATEETPSKAHAAKEKPANKRPDRTTMEGMIWNGTLEAGVYA